MDSRSLKYVAEACGAGLTGASPETGVTRVCTDSRQVQRGDLFFALQGERFDGHDFLADAAASGVAAVVADRNRIPAGLTGGIIAVENPRAALGRLAARYRLDFALPLVAVGGSNGKTSTKELIASVLRQKFNSLWSEASFNNDVGVPVTLLRLESGHQAAVLEIGTNHPGELAPLVRMARPQYGVITSLGREHLEYFKDLDGVVTEEGWLAELLPPSGKLFLNGDSPWTETIAQRSRAAVVKTGLSADNDWRAVEIKMDAGGCNFQVRGPEAGFDGEYRINLLGRHQVANALFAVAIGAELGLTRAEIKRGLTGCKPAKMRLQSRDWHGVLVLDDAYNANADSMRAALETLAAIECPGRRVAVLGDMAELGAHSEAAHAEVGKFAAESGVQQLFAVGKMAALMADAARAAGCPGVAVFADVKSAADAVKEFLQPGDVMLMKASRATRLEQLTEILESGASKKV